MGNSQQKCLNQYNPQGGTKYDSQTTKFPAITCVEQDEYKEDANLAGTAQAKANCTNKGDGYTWKEKVFSTSDGSLLSDAKCVMNALGWEQSMDNADPSINSEVECSDWKADGYHGNPTWNAETQKCDWFPALNQTQCGEAGGNWANDACSKSDGFANVSGRQNFEVVSKAPRSTPVPTQAPQQTPAAVRVLTQAPVEVSKASGAPVGYNLNEESYAPFK